MIQIENLSKIYQADGVQTKALNHVSLQIKEGEFVAITGRSGCGKSTLLHILGAMDTPTEGSYRFDGTDVLALKGKKLAGFRNREIGFVFQAFYLAQGMSARDNAELYLGYAGMKRKARHARAHELLCQVGLEDRMKALPSQLSGGQQQRVAIARAVANHPKVLLADEPTGNLDEENSAGVLSLLKKLHAAGQTIVMVTHDLELAGQADRVIHMSDGKIIS